MTAMAFSRWFLAAFFVFVSLFYTVTIVRKKRTAGASPVIRGQPSSRHQHIHDTFRVFRALILVVCVVRVPYPGLDRWLIPVDALYHGAVMLAGNAIMALSFAIILALHRSMGPAWRSGIDSHGPAALKTDGAFAVSRNPMFLFIQAAQVGLFLSLPTVFTLVCLVVGVWAIQSQVRLEEEHLRRHFGDAYEDYCARVPRWLFRAGPSANGSGATPAKR
jgi:protein-S-isoprenylcysteine O-methyltransferase Ste14